MPDSTAVAHLTRECAALALTFPLVVIAGAALALALLSLPRLTRGR